MRIGESIHVFFVNSLLESLCNTHIKCITSSPCREAAGGVCAGYTYIRNDKFLFRFGAATQSGS